MTHRNSGEPNEFSQKMHKGGTGGLGAGPWSESGEIGIKPRPAAMHPGNIRSRSGPPSVPPGKHVPCLMGDRILTGLAILSLGMLIVGAMGAYLSNDSQRVATTAAGAPASPESSEMRLDTLERRITDLDDRYTQRLHTLETRVADVIEPYGARLKNVEAHLATSGEIDVAHMRELEHRLEQFDGSTYEARLKAVENRLEQSDAPDYAELRDTESRLGQSYAAYDTRLRDIETRLMQIQGPYERRVQELEQRLIYAYARLDYLSARMESFINDNKALMEANATLHTAPTAAGTIDNMDTQPSSPAGPPEPDAAESPPTQPDADSAGTVAPAAEATSHDAVSPGAAQVAEVVQDMPTTREPTMEPAELPRAAAASAPSIPAVVANVTAPQRQVSSIESAADTREDNGLHQSGTGGWAINLASYASEGIASRKLADFNRKGVSAEQVAATVKGKTIYRVRVAGFDSRKAALAQAESIRQRLGLKEIWVTKP
jgi:cell division septation protein DedD